jgi:hypothetical protein
MMTLDLAEAALADRDWARVRSLLRDLSERAESDRPGDAGHGGMVALDDVDCSIEVREQRFMSAAVEATPAQHRLGKRRPFCGV